MSRSADIITGLCLSFALLAGAAQAQSSSQRFPGIGRTATPQEVAAWDIDVRPDFAGLPKGSGSVSKGQQVWEAKCASCHGSFGESNEVFTPIVGGTTKKDVETGRAAALSGASHPQRSSIMKLATVSTLWDYINRAMPWTAPKTLTTEEVYAVTAYILNLAEVVADDFTLSDANIAEVQKRMPNRNGMTIGHGMWSVTARPDVKNTACMKDCPVEGRITSSLPEYARNAHGNLAQQNRNLGGVRGVDTSVPAGKGAGTAGMNAAAQGQQNGQKAKEGAKQNAQTTDGAALAGKHGCVACHGMQAKIVGPGFAEIGARYQSIAGADKQLAAKIRNGSSGAWGAIPMPPQAQVGEDDIQAMVNWILRAN